MISGLQKMTLLDYPGKVACTVFLQGCNFRCPFCHNSELLPHEGEELMSTEEFFTFLRSRKGLLDAVCVSGGEPTLCPELEELLRGIKELGFAVKLDTNGARPDVLKRMVEQGLVDYVAMDVKNSPARYAATAGLPSMGLDRVEESLKYLLSGVVEYEFRTTVVEQLHDEESITSMGEWLLALGEGKRAKKLFLQSFVDRDTVAFSGLSAAGEERMAEYARLLSFSAETVLIRN